MTNSLELFHLSLPSSYPGFVTTTTTTSTLREGGTQEDETKEEANIGTSQAVQRPPREPHICRLLAPGGSFAKYTEYKKQASKRMYTDDGRITEPPNQPDS